MRILVRVAVVGSALLVLAGCSGSGSDPTPVTSKLAPNPVELTQGDGCGEAYFWAATASGDVAVTVNIEARSRSAAEPTTYPLDLPDDEVTVRVLRGRDLPRNFCTDVIDGNAQPTSEVEVQSGTGSIVLDPLPPAGNSGCGTSDKEPNGTLRLTGLVADDGTVFEPIEVETGSIGCYSG